IAKTAPARVRVAVAQTSLRAISHSRYDQYAINAAQESLAAAEHVVNAPFIFLRLASPRAAWPTDKRSQRHSFLSATPYSERPSAISRKRCASRRNGKGDRLERGCNEGAGPAIIPERGSRGSYAGLA